MPGGLPGGGGISEIPVGFPEWATERNGLSCEMHRGTGYRKILMCWERKTSGVPWKVFRSFNQRQMRLRPTWLWLVGALLGQYKDRLPTIGGNRWRQWDGKAGEEQLGGAGSGGGHQRKMLGGGRNWPGASGCCGDYEEVSGKCPE